MLTESPNIVNLPSFNKKWSSTVNVLFEIETTHPSVSKNVTIICKQGEKAFSKHKIITEMVITHESLQFTRPLSDNYIHKEVIYANRESIFVWQEIMFGM